MIGPTIPLAGVAVAAWSSLPPYAGPALVLDPTVEVVDHVLPAVVVLAVSVVALALRRRATAAPMFAAGLLVVLAGFWMTVTHVPLVAQATRGEVSWAAATWHSVPGLAVLALGAVWAVRLGKEPAPDENTSASHHHQGRDEDDVSATGER